MNLRTPVAILVLLVLITVDAFSQRSRRNRFTAFTSETQFSVGPELVAIFPSGLGGGVSLRYEQPLKVIDHLTVTAFVGLISYSSTTSYDVSGSGTFSAKTSALWIPVLGGAKYYYPGSIFRGLYGSFEAGFGFGSSTITYKGNVTGTSVEPATVGTFTVAPGAGYHSGMFDFSLRYFSAGLIGFRAAYVFRLK